MITFGEIISAAKAMSNFSDGTKVVTTLELIPVIQRYLRGLYTIAARENKYYFATTSQVSYDAISQGWPRPVEAESVIKAALASSGAKITILPLEDPFGELAPAIYLEGSVYKSSGRLGDPTNTDAIRFTYSKRYPDVNLTGLTVQQAEALPLDPSWPDQFNDMPIFYCAAYIARKDGRNADHQALLQDLSALGEAFIMHLGHSNAGMVSRYAHDRLIGLRQEPAPTARQ